MADVQLTANLQPAPACYPPDINTLLQLIAGGGITGSIPDSLLGGSYRGSAAPSDPITNPIWFRVDGAGRPLGIYMFYNGHWRKVYTGVGLGEIRMWAGGTAGIFDGTGRGVIGGDLDGWAICNGGNGTVSLGDRFIAPGYRFDGVGWVTKVSGSDAYSGGAASIKIALNNLPALFDHHSIWYSGKFQENDSASAILGPWAAGVGSQIPINIEGVGANDSIVTLPPYVAFGFIQFVGYQ